MAEAQSTIYVATYRSKNDFRTYLPDQSQADNSPAGQENLWFLKLTLKLVPSQSTQQGTTNSESTWQKQASEVVDSLKDVRVGRLLYVHGFNNTPDAVIQRAAQLKRDLSPDSDVVAFVWKTSKSAEPFTIEHLLESYTQDERELPNAVKFLWPVLQTLPDGVTKLLAHSMGCRLTSMTLHQNSSKPRTGSPLHVILAAADVSVKEFLQNFAPAILKFGGREIIARQQSSSTFIVNAKRLSSIKMSHIDSTRGPRVGQTPNTYGEMEELSERLSADYDLISCTGAALKSPDPPQVQKEYKAVNQRFILPDLHGYYATSPLVLADVRKALQGTPANQRDTLERYKHKIWQSPIGQWWRVKY